MRPSTQELSRPSGAPPTEAPDDPALVRRIEELRRSDAVARAERLVRERDERTLAEQVELTEVPAPPFAEGPRGERMAALMTRAGLRGVTTDEVGNVRGWVGEAGPAPLVVAAHLDTVFPAGTDVTVRRDGDRLLGPGISDDGRGLAALLALGDVLARTGLGRGLPLMLVATVGEEGAGDLRGVRHLFRADGAASGARGFVSLDGAGLGRIVHRGLGSRRYRVVARGPGGHSWVDWGRPNPIHALGRLVTEWTDLGLPDEPPTALTVGRWGGGTAVNAIPAEAWVELEVRSEGAGVLDALDDAVRSRVAASAEREKEGAGDARLEYRVESLGARPAGETPPGALLVRAAAAATRAVGTEPWLATSSTDANIPMTLGVPAVTLGAGGEAGRAHTEEEWYRNRGGPAGIVRALLTVLALEGAEAGRP